MASTGNTCADIPIVSVKNQSYGNTEVKSENEFLTEPVIQANLANVTQFQAPCILSTQYCNVTSVKTSFEYYLIPPNLITQHFSAPETENKFHSISTEQTTRCNNLISAEHRAQHVISSNPETHNQHEITAASTVGYPGGIVLLPTTEIVITPQFTNFGQLILEIPVTEFNVQTNTYNCLQNHNNTPVTQNQHQLCLDSVEQFCSELSFHPLIKHNDLTCVDEELQHDQLSIGSFLQLNQNSHISNDQTNTHLTQTHEDEDLKNCSKISEEAKNHQNTQIHHDTSNQNLSSKQHQNFHTELHISDEQINTQPTQTNEDEDLQKRSRKSEKEKNHQNMQIHHVILHQNLTSNHSQKFHRELHTSNDQINTQLTKTHEVKDLQKSTRISGKEKNHQNTEIYHDTSKHQSQLEPILHSIPEHPIEILKNHHQLENKLKSDLLIYSEKNFHVCRICRKKFTSISCLNKHFLIHSVKNSKICGICQKKFTFRSCLMKHMLIHTKKPNACNVYKKRLTLKNSLKKQFSISTRNKFDNGDICQKRFPEKSKLTKHVLIKKEESSLKHETLHKCEFCEKRFLHKNSLKFHLYTHSGEKPHNCDKCEKSFIQKSCLNVHMLSHTEDRQHKCNFCEKKFKLKGHLVRHLLTHSEEKPHKCDKCEESFKEKYYLNRHLLTHTINKCDSLINVNKMSHKCDNCGKSFTRESHLNRHILIHTGEKPHKCDYCEKRFTQRIHLSGHFLTHTVKNPYKCNICQKIFTEKGNMKRHLLTHTREKRTNVTTVKKVSFEKVI